MSRRNPPPDDQHTNAKEVLFVPKANGDAAKNRADFIRFCKADIEVFGADLDWGSWKWPGISKFVKYNVTVHSQRIYSPSVDQLMDPAFVDFAKACIRYMGKEPCSQTVHYLRITALRALEAALLDRKQSADPSGIDLEVFDRALQLVRESSRSSYKYNVGQKLEQFAGFFTDLKLVSHQNDVSSFRNSIRQDKAIMRAVGLEADQYRRKKLPDIDALHAIGSVFAKGWPPDVLKDSEKKKWLPPVSSMDPKDIYVTSVVAILLGVPCRIGEVHLLNVDLEIEEKDSKGDLQYGWRWFSLKGFGDKTSWVPQVWVSVAKEAVRRLMVLTEGPRQLAIYIEKQQEALKKNPDVPLRFYRHVNCPKVPDDKPLSMKEKCQALGYSSNRESLTRIGLKGKVWTLNSLWKWVLERLPPHFPYINAEKSLKFSEALFCMHRNFLHSTHTTRPVGLWIPGKDDFANILMGLKRAKGFFERNGLLDEEGRPFKFQSKQPRHLLNTLAHMGGMNQEDIDYWSGRKKYGFVYNHTPDEIRIDQALENIKDEFTSLPPALMPKEGLAKNNYWDFSVRPNPVSCKDKDVQPMGSSIKTPWGNCEHDYLIEPCPKWLQCLKCGDHYCIKGLDKESKACLKRIKEERKRNERDVRDAEKAVKKGYRGAEGWLEVLKEYAERLDQLIAHLSDPNVPDGTIIRPLNPAVKTHLERVFVEVAMKALEDNTPPSKAVMELCRAARESRPFLPGEDTAGKQVLSIGDNDGEK